MSMSIAICSSSLLGDEDEGREMERRWYASKGWIAFVLFPTPGSRTGLRCEPRYIS